MKLIEDTDVVVAFGSVVNTNKTAYLRACQLIKTIEEKHPDRLYCIHDGIRKFLHVLDVYSRREWHLLKVNNVLAHLQENSKFHGKNEKTTTAKQTSAKRKSA